MRNAIIAAVLLTLCGCAANPVQTSGGNDGEMANGGGAAGITASGGSHVKIRWQKATLAEVNEICNMGVPKIHRKRAWGCYRRAFDVCTIYTAGPTEDPQLHDTIGHEVRHCFEGAFHK